MRFRVMFSVLGGITAIGVLAIASWFLGERAILWIGSNQFKNELVELKRLTFRMDYLDACQESGTKRIKPVTGLQLRFISESEYLIEPVCQNSQIKAQALKQGKLLRGIQRLYGPGIIIPIVEGNPEIKDGWVELILGKTTTAVGFFNGQTEIRWKIPDSIIGGESPAIASCTDWGFMCCQSGNTEGVGVQAFPADCVSNCFQSCNQRPVVLFFNTDPLMNRDRVVLVEGSSATIQFGFEVNDFDGNIAQARLDYGDGETSSALTAKESLLSHTYVCRLPECRFAAVLSAVDGAGSSLADGQTNRVLVIMQP